MGTAGRVHRRPGHAPQGEHRDDADGVAREKPDAGIAVAESLFADCEPPDGADDAGGLGARLQSVFAGAYRCRCSAQLESERLGRYRNRLKSSEYTSPIIPTSGLRAQMSFWKGDSERDAAVATPQFSSLDHRSLNIDTFNAIYVLMGHALPEEAQSRPVQRAGSAQAGVRPQISNRGETAHTSGGVSFGFAIWPE